MNAISTYWSLPPSEQAEHRKALAAQELQALADEKHMLVYNGKLIEPEDYPCDCELEEAQSCYEQRKDDADVKWTEQEIKDKYCWCPCHTWSEGAF